MPSWLTFTLQPRHTKMPPSDHHRFFISYQLHHSSDASEVAYGGVSYLRFDHECRLAILKARLAPIKPTSILHLELLAAVVATDVDQIIKRHMEIPINGTFFWTDSKIVPQHINKDRRFQSFVANRIAKIHERSEPSQWWRDDSASNPADDVFCGLTASEVLSSERWVSGPTYLWLEEQSRPAQPVLGDLPEEAKVKHTKEVYTSGHSSNHATNNAMSRLLQR